MSDWKQRYEDAADAEYARYSRLPLIALLGAIKTGMTGEYYTLWRVVAERATVAQAASTLFNYLLADRPMLDRYHCASALLNLLKCTELTPTQLSGPLPRIQTELARLRTLVEQAQARGVK